MHPWSRSDLIRGVKDIDKSSALEACWACNGRAYRQTMFPG